MKCSKAETSFFNNSKLKRLIWVSTFPEYLKAPAEEHEDWQNMEHTLLKWVHHNKTYFDIAALTSNYHKGLYKGK